MIETLTLHVRLTKSCNADCSYCSSWQESPSNRMSPEKFRISLDFIWRVWEEKGITPEYITIEYVGGEILLIPPHELEETVKYARRFFRSRGVTMKDGVQSNLIGSSRRLSQLFELFNGRVGTSIDNTTDKRTLKGSRDAYIEQFTASDEYFKKNHASVIPGVFTMDRESISGLGDEIRKAAREMRNLTIRPVFKGGLDDVNFVSPEQLADAMTESFDMWFMRSSIVLEPHAQLVGKWISLDEKKSNHNSNDLCPFQNNCAKRSLSLEPNGDLYVCQELGDVGQYSLGNAAFNNWNEESWEVVSKRPENLDPMCKACPYLAVCQGGCMMQAIQDGKGPYGRPDYCLSWKAIFRRIESGIAEHGRERVKQWLHRIS